MVSRGIVYILFASFAFACMNITAKYLGDMHPLQIIGFRTLGSTLFITPYMLFNRISFKGNNPKFLLLRSLAGLVSLTTFFMAIQRIPLGSAISIRYLGPIFGALLAFVFLKEKVSKGQWISFLIAFSGVVIIKGFDLRIDGFSLILSFISAFFIGIVFVLIRYLATREHFLTIINYFMLVSLAASLLFISQWRMPVGYEWFAITSIGIFGLIGQILMTKAFQLEEASVLAPFKYMELVFAVSMGFIWFGEGYTLIPMLGILLIICGMMANVYFKKKQASTVPLQKL